MSYGRIEQIEGPLYMDWNGHTKYYKKWYQKSRSNSTVYSKKAVHRVERRRAKRDPECAPNYNRYQGWEW